MDPSSQRWWPRQSPCVASKGWSVRRCIKSGRPRWRSASEGQGGRGKGEIEAVMSFAFLEAFGHKLEEVALF